MPKVVENKKKSQQTPSKDPLGIKSGSTTKRGVRDYLMSVSKIDLLVGTTKNEANQVLGSPLTESTQRMKPTTSKATVSEEGAKTQSHNLS